MPTGGCNVKPCHCGSVLQPVCSGQCNRALSASLQASGTAAAAQYRRRHRPGTPHLPGCGCCRFSQHRRPYGVFDHMKGGQTLLSADTANRVYVSDRDAPPITRHSCSVTPFPTQNTCHTSSHQPLHPEVLSPPYCNSRPGLPLPPRLPRFDPWQQTSRCGTVVAEPPLPCTPPVAALRQARYLGQSALVCRRFWAAFLDGLACPWGCTHQPQVRAPPPRGGGPHLS